MNDILSREEIEERLADVANDLANPAMTTVEKSLVEHEREALLTAKKLYQELAESQAEGARLREALTTCIERQGECRDCPFWDAMGCGALHTSPLTAAYAKRCEVLEEVLEAHRSLQLALTTRLLANAVRRQPVSPAGSEEEWRQACERYEQAKQDLAAALANPALGEEEG